jgi:Acetyltransferase (GNAT) domain
MSSPAITTRFLGEADYANWKKLVAESAEGSPYYLAEYLDALCRATGGSFRILVAERGAELLGGVTLYSEASRWGRIVSPRLLLYYNGFVLKPHTGKYPSECASRRIKILTALEESLSKEEFGRLRLKSRGVFSDTRVFLSRGWSARPTYTYVVQIKDLAASWNLIEQNLRRLIQRCERDGVQVTQDDDFESFHRMHVETHERKGAPLYLPGKAFREFFEGLAKQGLLRLYHARLADGKSISSQLVLAGGHPTSHTISASADSKYLNIGGTPFLRWKVFQDLSKLGYTANDLTDAELNPVTHFKSQLGGDLETCLVVSRSDSSGFRFGETLAQFANRARGGVGAIKRKLTERKSPAPKAEPTP